tara:strand:+ start:109 stop:660 length:552 start_codon:yes stop_codon:yes gene_type:complete
MIYREDDLRDEIREELESELREEWEAEKAREEEDDKSWEAADKEERRKNQEKYEEEHKQNFDNYNAIIVETYGEMSRMIITEEDQKHLGKVANEKMQFFLASQEISRLMAKKGITKLQKTDRDYQLYRLSEVVSDNGLKALQMKELYELKPLIVRSDITNNRKESLHKLILTEISGRQENTPS